MPPNISNDSMATNLSLDAARVAQSKSDEQSLLLLAKMSTDMSGVRSTPTGDLNGTPPSNLKKARPSYSHEIERLPFPAHKYHNGEFAYGHNPMRGIYLTGYDPRGISNKDGPSPINPESDDVNVMDEEEQPKNSDSSLNASVETVPSFVSSWGYLPYPVSHYYPAQMPRAYPDDYHLYQQQQQQYHHPHVYYFGESAKYNPQSHHYDLPAQLAKHHPGGFAESLLPDTAVPESSPDDDDEDNQHNVLRSRLFQSYIDAELCTYKRALATYNAYFQDPSAYMYAYPGVAATDAYQPLKSVRKANGSAHPKLGFESMGIRHSAAAAASAVTALSNKASGKMPTVKTHHRRRSSSLKSDTFDALKAASVDNFMHSSSFDEFDQLGSPSSGAEFSSPNMLLDQPSIDVNEHQHQHQALAKAKHEGKLQWPARKYEIPRGATTINDIVSQWEIGSALCPPLCQWTASMRRDERSLFSKRKKLYDEWVNLGKNQVTWNKVYGNMPIGKVYALLCAKSKKS